MANTKTDIRTACYKGTFPDNFRLNLGDSKDVYMTWDGTDLDVIPAADDSVFNFGNGTLSFDVKVFGNTADDYLVWDASASALYTKGKARIVLDGVATTSTTDGSVVRMGTSASPLSDTQNGAGFVVGYFTTSDTAGWPAGVYTKTTFTGAGGNGTGLEGDVTLSAVKGTVTGIECFMELTSASGGVTGAARACQATVDFPSAALPVTGTGVYSAACFNIKGEGSSADLTRAQQINCLELKTEGTFSGTGGKNFQTHPRASIIYLNGFTPGSGSVINNATLTWASVGDVAIGMRVGVGTDGGSPAVYYVPMIPAASWD